MAALAGCGGSSDTTATTSPAVVLTSAQVTDALLTVDDLPAGWSQEDSATKTGDLTFGMGAEEGKALCPSGATASRSETHDKATVDFESESGSVLTQELGTAPDAEAHYADLKAAFASCVGQTWTEGMMTGSITEVRGPEVGDESVSYQLGLTFTAAGESMSDTIDVTLARRATVIQLYAYTGNPAATTGDLTPEQLAAVINTGDQKVAAALEKAASSTGTTATVDDQAATTLPSRGDADPNGATQFLGNANPDAGSLIFMSAPVAIPAGEPGKLSIALSGAPFGDLDSTVPVVLRNNTDAALTRLRVTGTARAADGTYQDGYSAGFEPATIQPGEWAMGYVYFPAVVLPAGVTIDYVATGEQPDKVPASYKPLPVSVSITEAAIVTDNDGSEVTGTLENRSTKALDGPTVMLMCFDGATPIVARIGSTGMRWSLQPGATSSFRVGVLSGETCPVFALAGSGWPVS